MEVRLQVSWAPRHVRVPRAGGAQRLTISLPRWRRGGTAKCIGYGRSLDRADRGPSTTRGGLDHLAFAVADRAALDEWADRFAAANVPHSPVAPANSIPGAAVLVFRDPDSIQLELFYQPLNG